MLHAVEDVALCAGRLLGKLGCDHPEYAEWRDLASALLKLQPHLTSYAREPVRDQCSTFCLHQRLHESYQSPYDPRVWNDLLIGMGLRRNPQAITGN